MLTGVAPVRIAPVLPGRERSPGERQQQTAFVPDVSKDD